MFSLLAIGDCGEGISVLCRFLFSFCPPMWNALKGIFMSMYSNKENVALGETGRKKETEICRYQCPFSKIEEANTHDHQYHVVSTRTFRRGLSQPLGRVRSIVNYDKTYGIFLRGFAKHMVHSSITDHIDRDGAKCCNSNLPYPMLMKLSGQTNSLLSCVV